MNTVKELVICLLDDEICYGPEEGQSNITEEMRQKWDEIYPKLDAILREKDFITNETIVEKDDAFFNFKVNEDISFDRGIEILHALEQQFKSSFFSFYSEPDDWDGKEPYMAIGLYTIK